MEINDPESRRTRLDSLVYVQLFPVTPYCEIAAQKLVRVKITEVLRALVTLHSIRRHTSARHLDVSPDTGRAFDI